VKGDQPSFYGLRQSYSQPRCASLGGPFRSPMNNYWMTNKAMQMAATGFVLELPDDFSILFRYDTPSR
jgi:hypothetical protein